MVGKLSQENAARLIDRAQKWVDAELDHCSADNPKHYRKLYNAADRAKKKFETLIAQLTDSEGL